MPFLWFSGQPYHLVAYNKSDKVLDYSSQYLSALCQKNKAPVCIQVELKLEIESTLAVITFDNMTGDKALHKIFKKLFLRYQVIQ